MSFDRTLLQEPDGQLLLKKNSEALLGFLSPFTIPLVIFRHGTDRKLPLPEDHEATGSGVLVRIGDKHFIFTAGHCVARYDQQLVAFGIETTEHRYVPDRWPTAHRDASVGGRDFGFIIIPPSEVSRFSAGRCVFAGPSRLLVATSAQLRQQNDWMILTGFPGEIQETTRRGMGSNPDYSPRTKLS